MQISTIHTYIPHTIYFLYMQESFTINIKHTYIHPKFRNRFQNLLTKLMHKLSKLTHLVIKKNKTCIHKNKQTQM